MTSLRSILQAFLLLLGMASAAAAGPYEDALPKFAADSYADTEAAIGAVAGSGHGQSLSLVEALRDGRLMIAAGQVYIRDPAGTFVDAATGQAIEPPSGAKPVRVNNRVRRAIEAALGSMTLLSPDAAIRLDAARAVFRSRDAAALPALEKAIAQESDTGLRNALESARAAIVLSKPDASSSQKLAAIENLHVRGDQDALALLSSLPPGTSADVSDAAAKAAEGIRSRLALWSSVQNVWYG
ncbi:MAG: urea ABC transporter permease subunit UrtB, partial [Microvirga sp.]